MDTHHNKNILHIGILGAMPEEIGNTINLLHNTEKKEYGDLTIFSGERKVNQKNGRKIYLSIAWSGWGKVSSARASTRLISHQYNNSSIDFLLFTGVAGSIDNQIKQWDIIIPEKLVQYDLDARPLFKQFFIPVFNKDLLSPSPTWYKWIFETIKSNLINRDLEEFNELHQGLIGTGDKFISNTDQIKKLKQDLPNLIAVEMEGCAVAQVAEQEGIPWVIIRVISDSADETAEQDFNSFLKTYNQISSNLIKILVENISTSPKFNLEVG